MISSYARANGVLSGLGTPSVGREFQDNAKLPIRTAFAASVSSAKARRSSWPARFVEGVKLRGRDAREHLGDAAVGELREAVLDAGGVQS